MSLLDDWNYIIDTNFDEKVKKDIEEIDKLIIDLNEINDDNNLIFCYLFYINYIYNINKTVVIYDSTFSNNIYLSYLYILDYYVKIIIYYLTS